jgi:hypothetical protein
MKTLITFSAAACVLASSAFAQSQWIETALWRAPQATTFTLKLRNRQALTSACSHFKSLIYQNDGTLSSWVTTNPQRMERLRRPIDPIVLDVDVLPYKKIEKVITSSDESTQAGNKLPHYTQTSAITGVNLDEFSSIKASVLSHSYTQLSRDLKLIDSEVEMMLDSRAMFVVNIKGLDVACDLFEGKGALDVKAPAYVVLTQDGYDQLSGFYNQKLLPEISDLFNPKKESATQRAIRLGYRTGKILEEEFPDLNTKSSEKLLMEITKTLFTQKNFEATSHVVSNEGRYQVSIPSSEEAKPVTVKLEF